MLKNLNDEQKTYLQWSVSLLGGLLLNQAGVANVTKIVIGTLITKSIIDYIDEIQQSEKTK